jgi:hypothetical protein
MSGHYPVDCMNIFSAHLSQAGYLMLAWQAIVLNHIFYTCVTVTSEA